MQLQEFTSIHDRLCTNKVPRTGVLLQEHYEAMCPTRPSDMLFAGIGSTPCLLTRGGLFGRLVGGKAGLREGKAL